MDESSRRLLLRLAKGLPLAAAPLGGLLLSGFTSCGCPPPSAPEVTTHPISMAQHASLTGEDGIDPDRCALLCTELRRGDAGLSDGGVLLADGRGTWTCTLDRPEDEEILTCSFQRVVECGGGRRPQAWRAPRRAVTRAGHWLAELACLEAGSVPAFDELATELTLHGAPSRLARVARRSADDERRHARVVASLARRFGSAPSAPSRGETSVRSLRAIADDNAVEGCAREALGALIAAHQAEAATDPGVRHAFSRIARDEARHALFSFALHDWSRRAGDAHARALEERRRAELASLTAELAEPDASFASVLGLPDAMRTADLIGLLAG